MKNMKKKYQAIYFDFDGTLCNSTNVMVEIINESAKKFSFRETTLEEVRHTPLHEALKEILFLKIPFIIWRQKKMMGKRIKECPPYEGVRELLETLLKEDIQVGILSSNNKKNIRSFFQGWGDAFEKIEIVEAGLFNKHKRIKKILRQKKYAPQEMLYVGDELRDYQAAQKSGVDCLLYTYGQSSRALLNREKISDDLLMDAPKDLLQKIGVL